MLPVPVSDTTSGAFAELAKVSVQEVKPLCCGANVIVNGAVCPACKVKGKLRPLRENSELLMLAAVTVTAPPVAKSVAPNWLLLPTFTLPKLKLDGETESIPPAMPVPVRGIDSVPLSE